MTSNSGTPSDDRSYAQIVSEVPPVPPAVLSRVAETPYGQRNPSWSTNGAEVPQIITALVLIEQSPAGKAWGVQLAAVPAGTRPSDGRFSAGNDGYQYFAEAAGCVEWFFTRSKVSETTPRANVKWLYESHHTTDPNKSWYGISFSCDAVLRMLHAAQDLDSDESKRKLDMRLAAMEKKLATHEADIASLNLKLRQLQVTGKARTPTVTCLMHLFEDRYTRPTCTTCNPLPTDTYSDSSSSDAPRNASTDKSPSTTPPTFNIAPHTDRLADLSEEAQNWFLDQLNTRSVWVRATDDPDSEDNHISWTPFNGAVKMGKNVAFWYGKHRFW